MFERTCLQKNTGFHTEFLRYRTSTINKTRRKIRIDTFSFGQDSILSLKWSKTISKLFLNFLLRTFLKPNRSKCSGHHSTLF